MQKFVGTILKNSFFVNDNWKLNNTKDWLKCHIFLILLFSILPIASGLAIGLIIKDYSIIYPLPFIIPWFILMKFFNLLVILVIQRMIDRFKRKKNIIIVSVLLNMVQSILYMTPLIIMLLVDSLVAYHFNIFMLLAAYVYLVIINFAIEYIYNKYFSTKQQNK